MKHDTHFNQELYQCQGWPSSPCDAIDYAENIPLVGVGENRALQCLRCNSRDLKLVEDR